MTIEKELVLIKEQLINIALIAASVYVIPAFIGSLIRVFEIGWQPLFIFHAFATLTIISLTIFRKYISAVTKVHLFAIIMHAIALVGFYFFKTAGGWYFIFGSLVVVTLILGRKKGLVYMITALLGVTVISIYHRYGDYEQSIDFVVYINSTTAFLNQITATIFMSFIIIYLGGKFYVLFTDYINQLSTKTNELHKALIGLQKSEERFKSFISNSPLPITIKNARGKYIYINDALFQLLGKSLEDVSKVTMRDFFSPETTKLLQNADEHVLIKNKAILKNVSGEINGTTQYFRTLKFPFENHDGSTLVGTVALNITEQKATEKMLIDSERKFRSMFDGSVNGILLVDADGNVLDCNKSFSKLAGISNQELFGISVFELLSEVSKKRLQEFMSEAIELNINQIETQEGEIIHKSGRKIPVEVDAHKLILNNELFFWFMIRDNTFKKEVDQKLYRAMVESEEQERERYAKELHDGLGPILSTSMIYVNSLQQVSDEEKKKEFIDRSIELLKDAVQNIKEISNNLSPVILQNYGLDHALKGFVGKLQKASDMEFSIKSDLNCRFSDLIEITLYRILTELINNTLKYAEATLIGVKMNQKNEELTIIYTDNGKGFDFDQIKKEGRGFGLINLENRINKINGEFSYVTKPGKGVVVTLKVNTNCI